MANRFFQPKLLRNFQVYYLKDLLKTFFESPTSFNKAWNESFKENGWLKASEIIETSSVFEIEENILRLEKVFTEEIIKNSSDTLFLFPIKKNITWAQNISKLNLPFSTSIRGVSEKNKDLSLIKCTQEGDEINFIFQAGTTLDDNNKETIFLIICTLDLKNSFLQIKYKKSHRNKSSFNNRRIFSEVIEYISTLEIVTVGKFNPSALKSIIFNMFEDESNRADKIIKNNIGSELVLQHEAEIALFLKETLNINEFNSDYYNDYKSKMVSIFLHQNAILMKDADFGDRYLFAFSFYDGYSTRSSTRNNDKNHVYTGNLYWTLKDLIIKKRKMSSISMYYKFSPHDFTFIGGDNAIGVEVNIKENSSLGLDEGCFEIDFLNTNKKRRDSLRGVKNDYVISEINRYVSKESQL